MAKILEYLFTEGSGQYVVNQAGSMANPTGNYIGAGEWLDAVTSYSGLLGNGATMTDDYADGPVTNSRMTRVQASGSNGYISVDITLPVATYTLSLYAKSNGANVDFRMSNFTDGSNGTKTATSSIQRFTHTFSVSSAGAKTIMPVRSDAGGDPYDLSIWGVRLDVGSSPADYALASGDLVLGSTGGVDSTDPAWVTGGVELDGSNDYGFGVMGLPLSVSVMTLYAVVKLTANPDYGPIISERYNSHLFSLSTADGTKFPEFEFNNQYATSNFSTLYDSASHVFVGRYDGTTLDLYLDGAWIASSTHAGLSAITIKRLILGNFNGITFPGDVYYIAMYDTAHDASTRTLTENAIRETLRTRTIYPTVPKAFIVTEGDSISSGTGSYIQISKYVLSPVSPGWVFAVPGSQISNLNSRASTVDATFAAAPNTALRILVVLIGANDLAGTAPATFKADLKTYCLARKAATPGLKIVILPVLPQTLAGFNANRNTANSLISGDPSFYDRLVVADSSMWDDAAASDTAKYSDGLHPTAAGHALIAPFVTTEIQALLDARRFFLLVPG